MLYALLFASVEIDVYQRAAGSYGGSTEPKPAVTRVTLRPTTDVTVFDRQYDREMHYQGTWLGSAADIRRDGDTALLHFANGMIVPVARDAMDKVFVALRVEQDGKISDRFPRVSRSDGIFADNRPIVFGFNKVVTTAKRPDGFDPWKFVDSLLGIEWVDSAAYLKQFRVSADSEPGWRTFVTHCQFCHSARGVGASLGWDFVRPIRLYTYRSKGNLYFHVKFRESDAPRKGYLMPALPDVTAEQIDALWNFLRDLAERDLNPYSP